MGEQDISLDIGGLIDTFDTKKNASSSMQRHHHSQNQHHQLHHHSQHQHPQSQDEHQQQQAEHTTIDVVLPNKLDDHKGLSIIECRICQEDDEMSNLEVPCACCGSLKYAHRKCVQRWCNEKGDTICEICQQPFKSGYTLPVRPAQQLQQPPSDLRELDFRDPRLLAIAERHFLQEYEDYAAANASGAACCRSAALILMVLLLLRHTLAISAAGSDEDASAVFMLFLLRAAGFLLPCYIMARALNILQRRRQRQSFSMVEPSSTARIPFVNFRM